jgi:hypothetical protein
MVCLSSGQLKMNIGKKRSGVAPQLRQRLNTLETRFPSMPPQSGA